MKSENMTDQKYNPTSKEFQDEAKRLKLTGYQLIQKYREEGKIVDPTNIDRLRNQKIIQSAGCKTITEYLDKCAKDIGFENETERMREYRHNTGRQIPMQYNPDCPAWFGNFIVENYIMKTFEDPIKMPYGNPGYDWICNKGQKIDSKARCLEYKGGKWSGWKFSIKYNIITDYFILSAWDNRDSLNPLHVWIFHKDDMVRKGKGGCAPRVKFWKRDTFSITNTPEGLKEFEKWEVTDRLDKLKEICNRKRKNVI